MVYNRKRMNAPYVLLGFVLLCVHFMSCEIDKNGKQQGISFGYIYDSVDQASFAPLDIREIPGLDGGYIILGKYKEYPYLLKIDNSGKFSWDTRDFSSFKGYKDPAPDLKVSGQSYYFFCRKKIEEKDRNIAIDKSLTLLKYSHDSEGNGSLERTDEIEVPNLYFTFEVYDEEYFISPQHTSITCEDDYMFVGQNNIGDIMVFVKVPGSGKSEIKVEDKSYWAGWACQTSYLATDRRCHYSGRLKNTGKYYFHTYQPDSFNFDLSKCFMIEMEDPGNSGAFLSIKLEKPIIAMAWDDSQFRVSGWGGMRVSGAYMDMDENYNNVLYLFINKKIEKNEETGELYIVDYENSFHHPDLLATKPVFILTKKINNEDYIFFTATSKVNQVKLYAYKPGRVDQLDERAFGEVYVYEAAGLIDTEDGGLAILGATYIGGLYKRICVFKLSGQEVKEICGIYN